MTLQPAFNCLLGCFYNELTIRHGLRFPLEKWLLRPDYFQVIHCVVHGYSKLSGPHPGDLIEQFLHDFPVIRTVVPEFRDVNQAVSYARDFIGKHGFIAAAHNLKHAPFETTTYDSDSWNYLLLTEITEKGECRVYSPYNNEYAEVSAGQLEFMLDTAFNYRHAGKFTPYMYWECEDTQSIQNAMDRLDELELYRSAVQNYPLEFNLHEGRIYTDSLKVMREHIPPEQIRMQVNEIHAFHRILLRSRQDLSGFLRRLGIEAGKEIDYLVKKWTRFNHLVALAILRNSGEEYERLYPQFEELIREEERLLKRLPDPFAAASPQSDFGKSGGDNDVHHRS